MKKTVFPLFVALSLFGVAHLGFAAGIPVVDATAIADRLKQDVKTAAQWTKEAAQWTKELKAYQDELLSKTGIRDVQGLIQDAKEIAGDLTDIYNEGTAFYDNYIENPTGILSEKAQALLDKYKVGEMCVKQGFSGDLIKGCEARVLSNLASVAYGENLQENINKDNKKMKGLIDQVKSATDPKSTADAANAIALEQLKFEKMKFQYEMYRDKQAQLSKYKEEMVQAEFKRQQLQATIPDYRKAYKSMQFNDFNN
ncbi:pilus assembly protein (plasmid) [Providencia stuartii]|uniref:type IV secretion system protein n=1 Tax=Providencia stuartii TaxID=588 RepID=UPI000909C307|nr:type IV secretion system protein [Providencia stuartii]APG53488.1 pilus assembly protein [Providencia stuartii]